MSPSFWNRLYSSGRTLVSRRRSPVASPAQDPLDAQTALF